ncbi:MAG: winged helix-turn-helix transcriptional regulator, partial [Candidatus Methanomethylicaceae archaeon]
GGFELRERTTIELLKKYLKGIVEVHLLDGQIIRGRLIQVDEDTNNIFLEECTDSEGKSSPATMIMGSSISHINVISPPSGETLEDKIFRILMNNSELTIDEIAMMLNIKPSSVRSALLRLKRKGLIPSEKTKEKNK